MWDSEKKIWERKLQFYICRITAMNFWRADFSLFRDLLAVILKSKGQWRTGWSSWFILTCWKLSRWGRRPVQVNRELFTDFHCEKEVHRGLESLMSILGGQLRHFLFLPHWRSESQSLDGVGMCKKYKVRTSGSTLAKETLRLREWILFCFKYQRLRDILVY